MPKKYIEAKTTIDQGLKNRKIMKIGCASGNAGRAQARRAGEGVSNPQRTFSPRPSPSRERELTGRRWLAVYCPLSSEPRFMTRVHCFLDSYKRQPRKDP